MAFIQHKRENIDTVIDIVGQFSVLMRRKKLNFWIILKKGWEQLSPLLFHYDLNFLEDPFIGVEINTIVANFPSNKFLGPNSFSTEFIRKSWTITKKELYDLFHQFY